MCWLFRRFSDSPKWHFLKQEKTKRRFFPRKLHTTNSRAFLRILYIIYYISSYYTTITDNINSVKRVASSLQYFHVKDKGAAGGLLCWFRCIFSVFFFFYSRVHFFFFLLEAIIIFRRIKKIGIRKMCKFVHECARGRFVVVFFFQT